MSMFILFNSEASIFIGCYSTMEQAKQSYAHACSQNKRIPSCMIQKVKPDTPAECFFGGYDIESEWTIQPGGDWVKMKEI